MRSTKARRARVYASSAAGYLRGLDYLVEHQRDELDGYDSDEDRAGDLSVYAIAVCFALDPLRVVADYHVRRLRRSAE